MLTQQSKKKSLLQGLTTYEDNSKVLGVEVLGLVEIKALNFLLMKSKTTLKKTFKTLVQVSMKSQIFLAVLEYPFQSDQILIKLGYEAGNLTTHFTKIKNDFLVPEPINLIT